MIYSSWREGFRVPTPSSRQGFYGKCTTAVVYGGPNNKHDLGGGQGGKLNGRGERQLKGPATWH